jgi:hypothetical protein
MKILIRKVRLDNTYKKMITQLITPILVHIYVNVPVVFTRVRNTSSCVGTYPGCDILSRKFR